MLLRFLNIIGGSIALLLGAIGAFLPILPTTPFILLAAFFFARGSPKLHNWLLQNKSFGPMISDWEQHRVIRLRAKWISSVLMSALMAYPVFFKDLPLGWIATLVVIWISVLSFIWSCPSVKGEKWRAWWLKLYSPTRPFRKS